MKPRLTSLLLIAILSMPLYSQTLPFQNPNLDINDRTFDLCSRLSPDEKMQLLQNASPAIERLGVPAFEWWNKLSIGQNPHTEATIFPCPMAMSASFDEKLVERVFSAVSDEVRAADNRCRRQGPSVRREGLSYLMPSANIASDPLQVGARETYGEDPFLASRLAGMTVRGLQGSPYHRYCKLLACARCLTVGHQGVGGGSLAAAPPLQKRYLYESLLPAFKYLVIGEGVEEMMCDLRPEASAPSGEAAQLLHHVLHDEWQFDGIVTTPTDLPPDSSSVQTLRQALNEGLMSEEELNRQVVRVVEARMKLGDFDPDSLVEWKRISPSVVGCDTHRQLALTAARAAVTLLTNRNGILPLQKSMAERIVVMGPNATDRTAISGQPEADSSRVTTLLEAIRAKVGQVRYVEGCSLTRRDTIAGAANTGAPVHPGNQALLQELSNADVILFCGGLNPQWEDGQWQAADPKGGSSDDDGYELPRAQREVIALLHAAGKHVILVNCSGRAVGLAPEVESTDAIVQAWYAGERGAEAVADVLFGDFNPCAKLPVTFYKSASQLPSRSDDDLQPCTYRYSGAEPLFPFGYGLTYSSFSFSKPKYIGDKLVFNISNTSRRCGTETVQVYIRRIDDAGGPVRTLRFFRKVELQPMENRIMVVTLPRRRFATWDEETGIVHVIPGKFELMVGNSSAPKDLKKTIVTIQ